MVVGTGYRQGMDEAPEDQIAVLQSRVRDRLAELRPIRPGHEAYAAASDAVIEAATELIDYEERLPALLDRAPRRLSLLIVRWSGVVTAALGASLGVAAVAGWTSRWWLPAVLPVLAAAAVLLRLPVRQAHLTRRPGSLVIAGGALVIAVAAVAGLPVWVAGTGLLLLAAGVRHVQRPRSAGPVGPADPVGPAGLAGPVGTVGWVDPIGPADSADPVDER